jgi:ribosomal protein L37AE/L43A
MKNFFRRLGYILTLRLGKAYSLPITDKDIEEAKFVVVKIKPFSPPSKVLKELESVFGKNGSKTLKSLTVVDSMEYDFDAPCDPKESLTKKVSTSDFGDCCFYNSVHRIDGRVVNLPNISKDSFKYIWVDVRYISHDGTISNVCSHYWGEILKRFSKKMECPECQKPQASLRRGGTCGGCGAQATGDFAKLPKLPDTVTFSGFNNLCKDLEKEHKVKLIPDGGLIQFGFSIDEDDE